MSVKKPYGWGLDKKEILPFALMIVIIIFSWMGATYFAGMTNEDIFGYLLMAILTSAVLIVMFKLVFGTRPKK